MHILVASDGQLDADKAVGLIARLYEPDDTVTLLTALDHPREFLDSYSALTGVEEVAKIAHEAGPGVFGIASGAKTAERLAPAHPTSSTEHPLNVYFTTTAHRRLGNLLERLQKHGIEATAAWSPTENQTSRTILDYAESQKVDLLVIGSHGTGRFEGALGSTVTKLMRRAPIPVLVIK